MLASLVDTCKMPGVNPVDYFDATLRAILDRHPQCGIEDPMPWRLQTTGDPENRGEHVDECSRHQAAGRS